MCPGRVSNPEPLIYESGPLPTAQGGGWYGISPFVTCFRTFHS